MAKQSDIAYATRVGAFDFALALRRDSDGCRVVADGAGA